MTRAPELAAPAGPLVWPCGGRLCLEIDLRAQGFVNIDFRDPAQGCIPLHLSLRRDARRIVANRWSPAGWRRELVFPAGLGARVHDLHLRLDRHPLLGARIVLWLDGQRIGQIDAAPRPARGARYGLRRGFPGLGRLASMTWPDALVSRRMVGAGNAPDLTPRLEILWGAAAQGDVLDLGDAQAPFLPLPGMNSAGPRIALLPGRIWGGGESCTLHLRSSAGELREKMTLQRHDLVQMLRDDGTLWALKHDQLMQLQMLEHVHHARLWADIPDAAHTILSRLSIRSGLHRFAPTANRPVPAPPPECVGAAVDVFHTLACGAGGAGLFRRLVDENALTPDQTRKLALMLCEWFCLNDDPQALARAARDLGCRGWRRPDDAWGDIAALPLLYAQGHWTAVTEVLQTYPRTGAGWVVTPAIGWLASALAGQRSQHIPPPDRRMAMLSALLELVGALAGGAQSQMGCSRIVAGMLDILQACPTLPDWAAKGFPLRIVQAFALCPAFWEALQSRADIARDPVMAGMERQFHALRAAFLARDSAALQSAARPFLRPEIAGHDRLRRALMAAPFLPLDDTGLPDLDQLAGDLPLPALQEACLRWLAAPRMDADVIPMDPADPVHKAACAGLVQATGDTPRPPFTGAGLDLGAQVQNVLGQIRGGRKPDPKALADIRDLAQGLRHPQMGDIGIAALLALSEALAHKGDLAQAGAFLDAALCPPYPPPPGQARLVRDLAVARYLACCPAPALRDRLAPCAPSPQPVASEIQALRAQANPFADTLVALISCRPNLAAREPAIRAAWDDALEQMGIPLITVVGREEGQPQHGHRLTGRLLELDAPDSYEGLPQKMLALADWACRATGFGRVLKIDDDCFLNARGFFSDPAFLTQPYLGRPLRRRPGDMDRGWHMARAKTLRGQTEIDKSPEPASYADGSTGYVLARPALQALATARASARGQALEQVSFMEDKLVGDLLALQGIAVSGLNHHVAIFRRSAPGLPPLPQYENGFLPFAGAAVKIAHLDSGTDPGHARAALATPWPAQRKVFPIHAPARLGWASNTLDLVSPPARLEATCSADLAVVAVMRNERFMLEHFLAHYRGLGVTGFLIADNGSDDGTLEHLAAQPDVAVFAVDTPYSQSNYGVIWQETLLANFRQGRWSLLADADELAFWSLPDADGRVRASMPDLLAGPDFAQAEAVKLYMLDMYPKGPLAEAGFASAPFTEAGWLDRAPLRGVWAGRGPWSNSATVTSALRHRLMQQAGAAARENLFVAQKFALLRYHPMMQLSAGLHYIAGARVARRALGLGHFKYHAEFHAKARIEAGRGQHFNGAEEYVKYVALCDRGQDRLFDPAHSVALAESEFLREFLGISGGARAMMAAE